MQPWPPAAVRPAAALAGAKWSRVTATAGRTDQLGRPRSLRQPSDAALDAAAGRGGDGASAAVVVVRRPEC